ncbi:hypothetical protein RB594_005320 [Gaeumannomyces avenae]
MHVALLNDIGDHVPSSASPPESTGFPRFSSLPAELRRKIWQHLLPAQRIIAITIESTCADETTPDQEDDASPSPRAYTAHNELGSPVSGAPYRIRLEADSRGLLSLLLRVNREARSVAMGHYRVHIPTDGGPMSPLLAIKPETDVIHFTLACWDADVCVLEDQEVDREVDLLADFLTDARAYDRTGLGILHIALGREMPFGSVQLPTDLSRLSVQAASGLRAALLGFRTVTFVSMSRTENRLMFGSLDHFAARYNRALPLWSSNANFQLLPVPDPRGTAGEDALAYYLEKVAVGDDPRGMIAHWQSMEAAFGTSKAVVAEKRVALASRPVETMDTAVDARLRSKSDAERYIASEAATWESRFAPDGIYTKFDVENPDSAASEAQLSIPQAVGFWLLPADALGPLSEGGVMDVPEGSNLVRDLSAHRPRLALFDLC